MPEMVDLLRRAAGSTACECIVEHEDMKNHTTFRIGGPADIFASPSTVSDLCSIVDICRKYNYPFYVTGNGSNLLVSDKGYRGLIIRLSKNFSEIETDPSSGTVSAQAGAMLSAIAKRAADDHLTGFEFASGIPGTIGGAVVMNAGAYGKEMKDVLVSVTVLTRDGNIRRIPSDELELGYRTSAAAKNEWIVLKAELVLKQGVPEEIYALMEDLRRRRALKQPLDMPSAGSTFKRPEGYFAGKLIMDAGLKGFTVGGAQVSEKHCGFVVNLGDATAGDVVKLIEIVTKRVREYSGVTLEPEIKLIGEF